MVTILELVLIILPSYGLGFYSCHKIYKKSIEKFQKKFNADNFLELANELGGVNIEENSPKK